MPTTARRQKVRESFSQLPGHLIRRVHHVSTAYFTAECGVDFTGEAKTLVRLLVKMADADAGDADDDDDGV